MDVVTDISTEMTTASSDNGTQPLDNSAFMLPSPGWFPVFDGPTLTVRILALVFGQGNWLLVFCYCFCYSLKTPFNRLVVVMATGDGLMSIIEVPLTLVDVFLHYVPIQSYAVCPLKVFTKSMSYHCSLLCIACIATVRFFSIVKGSKLSHYISRILAISILLISTAIALVVALDEGSNSIMVCRRHPKSRTGRKYFQFTAALASLTFVVMVVCYLTIVIKVLCHKHKVCKAYKFKFDVMTTWTSFWISVVFILCYLAPYTFLLIPKRYLVLPNVWHIIGLFDSLITLQIVLNPIIYFWVMRTHRAQLIQTLRWPKWFGCNKVGTATDLYLNTTSIQVPRSNSTMQSAAAVEHLSTGHI